jgi:RNA polymerase sigma factor (sigma-70 family)
LSASFHFISRQTHQKPTNLQKSQRQNQEEPGQDAFHELFQHYHQRVFNTALNLLQNREDAEDLTQEVFVAAYQKMGQFRGDAELFTWLYRLTTNRALDFLRAKKAKKRSGILVSLFGDKNQDREMPIIEPSDFMHPGIQLERQEQAAILFAAIEKLPEQQKAAFVLARIEHLSYAEIAQVLSTSIPAVESLLFRAKQNLQNLLKQYFSQENQ